MNCALFIKSFSDDLPWLEYALRSCDKFASGFSELVVALPAGVEFSWPTARIVHIRGETPENGYRFQQLVKLHSDELTTAENVLITDSDTIFTQPFSPETFMRDGKPYWLMTPYDALRDELGEDERLIRGVFLWREVVREFIGATPEHEYMRRQPFYVPCWLLKGLRAFCRVKHNVTLHDYVLNAYAFSEFNCAGFFAHQRSPDEFTWIDTTRETMPELNVLQSWSHGGLTDELRERFEEILKGGNHETIATPTLVSSGAPKSNSESAANTEGEQNGMDRSPAGHRSPRASGALPEVSVNPRIKKTSGGLWVLVDDTHISRWVEQHNSLAHDHAMLPKVLEEIPPGGWVVDVGASIGDSTASFIERVDAGGVVIAYEPNMDAYACLRRNCPTATCLPYALGAPGDPIMLELAPSENAGARYLRPAGFEKEKGESVQIATLDSDTQDYPRLDLLKIDAEGFELNILRGAEQTIAKFRPKLVIEINKGALARQGTDAGEVSTWLQEHGYEWTILQGEGHAAAEQYDILCTPLAIWGNTFSASTPEYAISLDVPRDFTPWQDKSLTLSRARELAAELRTFCTAPRNTKRIRDILREHKVIK